jgi:hypothetical protein
MLLVLLALACSAKAPPPGTNSCAWLVACTYACSYDSCVDACAEQATPQAIALYNRSAACETDAGCANVLCARLKCPAQTAACADAGTADGGP